MTAPHDKSPTSPLQGDVDREAGGRGSRFSRTKEMTARARYLCVLSNLRGVLSDLLVHAERLLQAEKTPTPTLPLAGGGRARTAVVSPIRPLSGGGRADAAIAVMESGT